MLSHIYDSSFIAHNCVQDLRFGWRWSTTWSGKTVAYSIRESEVLALTQQSNWDLLPRERTVSTVVTWWSLTYLQDDADKPIGAWVQSNLATTSISAR